MKRKLKGVHRYYPGCLYCMLIFIILSLIAVAVLAYSVGFENIPMDNAGTIVLFIIVFIPTFIICHKSGKAIFNFTEKIIRRRLDIKGKFEKNAHARAEILEFAVFFAVILLPIFLPLLIEHFNNSTTETNAPINGWDP